MDYHLNSVTGNNTKVIFSNTEGTTTKLLLFNLQ